MCRCQSLMQDVVDGAPHCGNSSVHEWLVGQLEHHSVDMCEVLHSGALRQSKTHSCTRTVSSSIQRPSDEIGKEFSQAPDSDNNIIIIFMHAYAGTCS